MQNSVIIQTHINTVRDDFTPEGENLLFQLIRIQEDFMRQEQPNIEDIMANTSKSSILEIKTYLKEIKKVSDTRKTIVSGIIIDYLEKVKEATKRELIDQVDPDLGISEFFIINYITELVRTEVLSKRQELIGTPYIYSLTIPDFSVTNFSSDENQMT